MHKTIAYLKIPDFFIQTHLLFYPADRKAPLVIGGSPDRYGLVLEVSAKAFQKGIRPGMLCRTAVDLYPETKIVPPDQDGLDYFIKRVSQVIDSFSLRYRKDRYDSFYLFLPDYYCLAGVVRQIQRIIRKKLGFLTQMAVSMNQHAARLAASVAGVDRVLFVDRSNAVKVFKDEPVSLIRELDQPQLEKLRMAGIRTVSALLRVSLIELKFILGEKACFIHENYLEQLKTVKDEDPFQSEEVLLCNAENDLSVLAKALTGKVRALLARSPCISKVRLHAEYVDGKSLILSRRMNEPVSERSLLQYLMRVLIRLRRRVRIRSLKIGVIPSLGSSVPLVHRG